MSEYLGVVLVSAGPRRHEVILRVKEMLGCSLASARDRVDAGHLLLVENRRLMDCFPLMREFEQLGATVRMK